MTYRNIRCERDDTIATITLNRPDRRNALSVEHMQEITDALRTIGASDARAVVIAAEGPVFSSGHDFGDMVERDLVAVGWEGEIWRFDGTQWQQVESPTNRILTCVCTDDDGLSFAGGRNGGSTDSDE